MPFVETIVSLLFKNLVSASSNAVIGHHHSPHHSLITDKAALLEFKKTIVYDPYSMLATWKEATDVCNFTSVSCNTQHHRVTDLILQDYALAGRLSPIVSNLTGLCNLVLFAQKLPNILYLHLSNNDMVSHDDNTNLDPFFAALTNCTSLEELELAGVGLGGMFPSSIGGLGVNFTNLLLQENRIFGSIPPDIGNLSKFVVPNFTSNLLNGTISVKISQLSNLEQLFVSHNLFTSAIPAELGQMTHLGLLDLSHNSFSGDIPSSIGDLVRLNYPFLSNNLLSGTIPPKLEHCIELYKLDLSYNRLTCSIPPQISAEVVRRSQVSSSNRNSSVGLLSQQHLSSRASVKQTPPPATALVNMSSPMTTIVNIKLDRTNYTLWLAQILPILKSHDLMGYVDGSVVCPSKHLAGSTTVNPAYISWMQQDQMILSWNNGSLTSSVLATVASKRSAPATWEALEQSLRDALVRR
ncbi:hypothetical protein DVH24_000010 [Malus domestica]|uniref:Leucine-rich repeat-containing N-terminal plant-type domain-containing protein n=1 Tax=Malus domestica TaxID=3750 RepID=A0A498J4L7_MALDO|nr:hypothetical protein DVH24_000010 [Malus domestica]